MYKFDPAPPAPVTTEESPPPIAYEYTVWSYRLVLPLMNAIATYVLVKKLAFKAFGRIPPINFILFDGLSTNSRRMKEGATRWPSLNTCYNFSCGQGPTVIHRALDAWWMRIRNAQAVRNRLNLAKSELHRAVLAVARTNKPVRILSLAAGTVQGVIQVAARCKAVGITTEIILVDDDCSAFAYARELARTSGVAITTMQGNVLFFPRVIGDFRADIVEMIGFLDYLRDGLAIRLA